MRLFYLSGPYSGHIADNIASARKIAVELWGRGYAILCPHLNTAHFEEDCAAKYEDYIEGDCRMIDGCDGLILIPGWEKSRGALLEKAHAESRGIPVSIWPALPIIAQPKSVLLEAEGLINGDRQAAYGHPLDDFSRTAGMLNGLFYGKLAEGFQITAEHIPIIMNAVKMSRAMNGYKRDTPIDGAGYWGTYEKVHEERERRAGVQTVRVAGEVAAK